MAPTSKPPYYKDTELLDRLRRRSKDARIQFHTRRVRRDRVVYEILDRVTASEVVDDVELVTKLEHTQRDIEELEAHIRVKSDSRFQSLSKALDTLCSKYLESAVRSQAQLIKYLGNSKEATLQTLLARLRKEEIWLDLCTGVEVNIQDICKRCGVPATGYMRIAKLIDNTRGPQMRKILKEHLGYER